MGQTGSSPPLGGWTGQRTSPHQQGDHTPVWIWNDHGPLAQPDALFARRRQGLSVDADGGTPVIVVHLDGRRFTGFLSDMEADPLSVLLLDSTTTTVPKRMVDTLRVLKGAMPEPKPCVVLLKDGSQRRGMLGMDLKESDSKWAPNRTR